MYDINILLNNIEQLISQKNISKMEFYKDISISPGSFGDWRSGKSKPSVKTLNKLATYFNCSLDELLENKKTYTDLNKNQEEILDIFNKLNEYYQKKLIKQAFNLLIEMCQEQDKELNSKKAYIAAFGGGTFEIDDETAKFIKENAVFKKYKPKEL